MAYLEYSFLDFRDPNMTVEDTLWPDQVSVGEIIYPPGSAFGPRLQTNVQFVWVYRGDMTVWIDGLARHAPAHTVCVLFPGHEERFRFSEKVETHHSWAHLNLPALPTAIQGRLERIPWPLPYSPAMGDLVFSALALRYSSLSTASELLKTLCIQIFWRYLGEGEQLLTSGERVSVQRLVEQACQFIRLHLQDPLTLAQISAVVSLSESHLIRLFHAQLGITPMAYVWRERVAASIELLKYSGLPLGAIAEQCGFQNSYHLSRRVKQATGLTPTQLRQGFWGMS